MEESDNTDGLAKLNRAFYEVANRALMMKKTSTFPNHW